MSQGCGTVPVFEHMSKPNGQDMSRATDCLVIGHVISHIVRGTAVRLLANTVFNCFEKNGTKADSRNESQNGQALDENVD
jgi:hypothetical protein